jgi:hypothetical protein
VNGVELATVRAQILQRVTLNEREREIRLRPNVHA